MTQEEKNIALLNFAGFKLIEQIGKRIWQLSGEYFIDVKYGDNPMDYLPNLFLSMDACEKYLIPQIKTRSIKAPQITFTFLIGEVACCLSIWVVGTKPGFIDYTEHQETMPSALCEAAGKAFKLWE